MALLYIGNAPSASRCSALLERGSSAQMLSQRGDFALSNFAEVKQAQEVAANAHLLYCPYGVAGAFGMCVR
ncbi:MAG TPA: hypothetical protein VF120_14395 [Ktedonobacterales bacterium]